MRKSLPVRNGERHMLMESLLTKRPQMWNNTPFLKPHSGYFCSLRTKRIFTGRLQDKTGKVGQFCFLYVAAERSSDEMRASWRLSRLVVAKNNLCWMCRQLICHRSSWLSSDLSVIIQKDTLASRKRPIYLYILVIYQNTYFSFTVTFVSLSLEVSLLNLVCCRWLLSSIVFALVKNHFTADMSKVIT